jgi:ribose transport system substrate-binding protein
MVASYISLVGMLPPAHATAANLHFDPDTDPSRVQWLQLPERLGPPPVVRGTRFGAVLKTQTNEYWRLVAAGYRKRAAADGVKLDIQAAQSEHDPVQQLAIMENMIGSRPKAILISPMSALNLQPAIEDAMAVDLPVVDVDGDVVDSITHFVGAGNREIGVRVADWFIKHYPDGGKVAVVEGQEGVFSSIHRTAGFRDTILASGKFEIVASVSAHWDKKEAYDQATLILREAPDLIGIYCNNDTMALGVVAAVKDLRRLDRTRVFGTDGIRDAYDSIRAGELTGTVDMFPMLIGEVGLEVAERLTAGQSVPRVVITPQAVVTKDNMARYLVEDDDLFKILGADAWPEP